MDNFSRRNNSREINKYQGLCKRPQTWKYHLCRKSPPLSWSAIWHLSSHHLEGDLLEQLGTDITGLTHSYCCFEFLCESWRVYFYNFNPGKVPFNDLLSTVLEVWWIGLHLSCAYVLDLHLWILFWSLPMLPSALVSGSHSDPRCQLKLIKISIMTKSWGFRWCSPFFVPDSYVIAIGWSSWNPGNVSERRVSASLSFMAESLPSSSNSWTLLPDRSLDMIMWFFTEDAVWGGGTERVLTRPKDGLLSSKDVFETISPSSS